MAEVKILVEGYTNADAKESLETTEEKTCATITLVRDQNLVIIVDPGVLESQNILIDKLKEEGLNISDINLVFLTHSHIDHYRNIGMFPRAKTLEYWGLWEGNSSQDRPESLSSDIKIISTPGHSNDSLTLLVNTIHGVVAICGDVFWKENYPELDAYANDMETLKKSRQQVLAQADWVIPGHGKMFKVVK
ncbi:MAG: MBL fold metallo-hydrolase [Planctomycetes bacterium]|jgi:glyoxylase-like metal-dependent hydrolase (beta-lactamase superfamily II)|nr:MBL fold metallo-hydrolase [Planctomycetota bacterium]